ncbi:hypothetical protein [Burkholderia sp. Nafp2/4-1b]|uniref:hypothetical protein n=1 Tax=Burkholderia sp. Nafp2/4-1b TaxID=2116686 RepID=UPI0013CE75F4|nr:hypothetical protein [Burkholderia sp. Nafp2/4-1b]
MHTGHAAMRKLKHAAASIRARMLATCVAIVVTALAVTGGLVYYVVKQPALSRSGRQ